MIILLTLVTFSLDNVLMLLGHLQGYILSGVAYPQTFLITVLIKSVREVFWEAKHKVGSASTLGKMSALIIGINILARCLVNLVCHCFTTGHGLTSLTNR